MKFSLVKQLLVVSLCTLLLPWTGCQYVREMETLIRQQQSNTLSAFTKPLAENIKSQPIFQEQLNQQNHLEQPFFAPRSKTPIMIDGYDDEWITYYQRTLLASKDLKSKPLLKTNIHKDTLYLFVKVADKNIRYYDPTKITRSAHDWLKLSTPNNEYQLFTSAPGNIQVFASQKDSQESMLFHDISGYWQEYADGYQVEVKIPLALAKEGLRLEIFDFKKDKSQLYAATTQKNLAPLLIPSEQLTQWLSPFKQEGWNLQVVNKQGWPLLTTPTKSIPNELPLVTRENLGKLLLNRIYRFFLEATLPVRYAHQWPLRTTQLSQLNERIAIETLSKNPSNTFSQWYSLNESNQSVLVVVQPITESQQVLGYVIATQTENALLSFTNDALRRVMNLSLLTFIAVVAVLLGYAVFISIRIKKLKTKTESAIHQDGSISPFHSNHASDELGELSNSYSSLLHRIKNYNDYLQSLTHKLAHEIRTPLAIVKSSLEMLESVPKEEQQTYLERALEGNQRLANILNAMSESTQVEQLVQNAEFQSVDLAALIKNLTEAYQLAYPDHQFAFEAENESANELTINANPELIAQMIDKLIDNARDFSEPNIPIRLSISDESKHAAIKVINHGPQLENNMSEQLFDSLISLRDKQQSQGTHLGLGLYIVRLIAKAHQGNVRAYNLSNTESVCFEVTLPKS